MVCLPSSRPQLSQPLFHRLLRRRLLPRRSLNLPLLSRQRSRRMRRIPCFLLHRRLPGR